MRTLPGAMSGSDVKFMDTVTSRYLIANDAVYYSTDEHRLKCCARCFESNLDKIQFEYEARLSFDTRTQFAFKCRWEKYRNPNSVVAEGFKKLGLGGVSHVRGSSRPVVA